MACCQERICLLFLFIALFWFQSSSAKGYMPMLKDFPTHIFQRHLKVSRHHPVCVVFRKTGGVGSKLEKTVYNLWQNKQVPSNYTTWEFGSFNWQKDKLPPKTKIPERLPSVRCYLGETSAYNYKGKADTTVVGQWLQDLASLHVEQSEEVTPQLLKAVQRKFKIVLIAFPDGPRHHEVEDMVYELASEVESCKALAVHLNSVHVKSLREKYGFSKYPSVVVLHNKVIKKKGVKEVVEDFRVFSYVEVNKHVLQVYLMSRTVLAQALTMDDIPKLLDNTDAQRSSQFRPMLVCFYAYWAQDVKGYLYAFNSTILQYKIDRVKLRYGLVDLTAPSAKNVINKYFGHGAMSQIPFLVMYYKDGTGVIQHPHMHTARPYPWVLYDHIKDIDNSLIKHTGVKSYTPPWGTVSFDQFSSLREGPNGSLCTPWSSNLTDNTPVVPIVAPKKIRVFVNKTMTVTKPKLTWHEKFDTDSIERQLSAHEGIPLLTQETWTKVVEKSHAPRHIFYKAGKWAGEVTKVSLVVFIMADCGNCRRNNHTFRDIQAAVSHVDGGAMYYVNCTAERELCASLNIRGYPIISAFRGLGWMDITPCLSMHSKSTFKKYVRMDYHGVLKTDYIMDWFSTISGNAVMNMKMDQVPVSFNKKDIKVVTTLVPIHPSDEATGPLYSYKCLRLMCERLYSLVDCYTRYSDTISEMEYHTQDLDLSVTKIEFYRSDGISTVLMKSGQSLYDTLEDMTDTLLHALHTSHSYGIKENQTCEEDPAACTDILTEFILDHSKLPVTPITSDLFHTASSSLKEENLPILIALVHSANITASSSFLKNLTQVAYEVYNSVTVMTLNVDKYSVWATKFVPKLYGHQRVWQSDSLDPLLMYVYPRLCIVKKSDHHHAALYPPVQEGKRQTDAFFTQNILEFVYEYLASPENSVVEMEEF